jgi:hypothetical protein
MNEDLRSELVGTSGLSVAAIVALLLTVMRAAFSRFSVSSAGRLRPSSRNIQVRPRRYRTDVFSATAARMSAFNTFSSILSPSWKSMARLVLP